MAYVERYVYINQVNAMPNATGSEVSVILGYGSQSHADTFLEVMSATARGVSGISAMVVKTTNVADNYSSPDLRGTTIAVMGQSFVAGTGYNNFVMSGSAPKLLFNGNMQRLTLMLETSEGLPLGLTEISPFSLVIKLSYQVPLIADKRKYFAE